MTMIFLGAVVSFLIYRATASAKANSDGTTRTAGREKMAFWLLLLVLGLLAAAEVHMTIQGEIYADGIAWIGMSRVLLFLLTCTALALMPKGHDAKGRRVYQTGAGLLAAALALTFFL